MEEKLIIFDFDGTLTKRDSMLEFTKLYHGKFRFILGIICLIPVLSLYKMNIISNWRAKEYFLKFFFQNESLSRFQANCHIFALGKIPSLIRPTAMLKLQEHRNVGDRLVIVSSSAENWLKDWCLQQNITLIATRLEVTNGQITGRLLGPNCYGPEKIARLKENFDIEKFQEVIVYGDSKGDYELYNISTKYFHKYFN
jgi:phosphatidylglycerophosphatase C